MISAYAAWITRRPVAWAVLVVTLVVGAVAGVVGARVEQDDDVLAFLPDTNPDIRAFREINAAFGSTDIALVGVPTRDPFDPEFLRKVQAATTALRNTAGIDSVLSMTNVVDFAPDPATGGIISGALVSKLPATDDERAALREKVMSRDHVVGTLISAEADAVLIYAFASPGQQPREIAEKVREQVRAAFPDDTIYWGGGPFISTAIYEATERDLVRLTPISIGAKVLAMLVFFQDLVAAALVLLATGVGILAARAVMVLAGIPFNAVLSSMPIILFATGSAFAIHLLSHYNQHARTLGTGEAAVRKTVETTGPTALVAGLTICAGLASFVTMDIQPMQVFGGFTAFGLFVTLLLSLSVVPAGLVLFPNRRIHASAGPLEGFTVALAMAARRHRAITAGALLAVVVGTGVGLSQLDARMDLSAFYEQGSEPDLAQRFLDEKFGGSQFIQIEVRGDFEEPEVLRELGRVGDQIRLIPHVTSVTTVEMAVSLVGEAMVGARRVPDTRGQNATLLRFLTNDPSSTRLITDDRTTALMQVRVGTNDPDVVHQTLRAVEDLVASQAIHTYAVRKRGEDAAAVERRFRDLFTARVRSLAAVHGVTLPADVDAKVEAFLQAPPAASDPEAVAGALRAFFGSEESFVTLDAAQAEAVARALAPLRPDAEPAALSAAVAGALGVTPDQALVGDVLMAATAPWVDALRRLQAERGARDLVATLGATLPADGHGERFVGGLAARLQDRGNPDAMVASADGASLGWRVNGMPVLYRGLAKSVTGNLFKSLGLSMTLVILLISAMYRSLRTGLLAVAPTALTVAVIYGGMGLIGMRVDIGTSMLASLVLGAGVDYAIAFLWSWEAPADGTPDDAVVHAARDTAHSMWANAVMIAVGFWVLTQGEAKPLQRVGDLTAIAMIAAAVATIVLIPLFATRRSYRV